MSIENIDLNSKEIAERLAYSLRRGRHYRRAGYYILRKVMEAGAIGVEIILSGVREQVFRAGDFDRGTFEETKVQCEINEGIIEITIRILK